MVHRAAAHRTTLAVLPPAKQQSTYPVGPLITPGHLFSSFLLPYLPCCFVCVVCRLCLVCIVCRVCIVCFVLLALFAFFALFALFSLRVLRVLTEIRLVRQAGALPQGPWFWCERKETRSNTKTRP